MNREDTIKLAREAGFRVGPSRDGPDDVWGVGANLERFAALVAAAAKAEEREACAKVCEAMRPSEKEFDQRFYTACTLNANAIRAMGETK